MAEGNSLFQVVLRRTHAVGHVGTPPPQHTHFLKSLPCPRSDRNSVCVPGFLCSRAPLLACAVVPVCPVNSCISVQQRPSSRPTSHARELATRCVRHRSSQGGVSQTQVYPINSQLLKNLQFSALQSQVIGPHLCSTPTQRSTRYMRDQVWPSFSRNKVT